MIFDVIHVVCDRKVSWVFSPKETFRWRQTALPGSHNGFILAANGAPHGNTDVILCTHDSEMVLCVIIIDANMMLNWFNTIIEKNPLIPQATR